MFRATHACESFNPALRATMARGVRLFLGPVALAVCLGAVLFFVASCTRPEPQWNSESTITLTTHKAQVWAIAPAINLSGQRGPDPLLQADLLFQQLQQVQGLTVVPVDRVAPVYVRLKIDRVQSQEQAALVCDLLGCDGLIVPTITAYDPYDPPKVGAALQLFTKPSSYSRPSSVDPRDLARRAQPEDLKSLPQSNDFVQVVGMFDAANGTTHQQLLDYAYGRYNPKSPLRAKEYEVSMDRYCGFVYRKLIEALLDHMYQRVPNGPSVPNPQ